MIKRSISTLRDKENAMLMLEQKKAFLRKEHTQSGAVLLFCVNGVELPISKKHAIAFAEWFELHGSGDGLLFGHHQTSAVRS